MTRLLIISHNALSNHANNGKTLTSLFSHRKDDEIAQLYFQNEVPESEKFKSFFMLRDIDVLRGIFFLGNVFGSTVQPKSCATKEHPSRGSLVFKIIKFLKRFESIKKFARELLFSPQFCGLRDASTWIDGIRPGAIFLIGSDYPFLFRVGAHFAIKHNIPLFLYMTDDYILSYKSSGFIRDYLNRKLRNEIKNAVDLSTGCFVIGDDMAKSYSQAFGVKFEVLCNSVNLPKMPVAKEYVRKSDFVIVYAGGLTLGRGNMLCEFMRLVRLTTKDTCAVVQLVVYSQDSVDSSLLNFFAKVDIDYRGGLSSVDLGEKLKQADYLLHVESDMPQYVERTKLSVSTKIPEYLSTGVCVIAFGPGELSSIRLFVDNGIGIVVDSLCTDQSKVLVLGNAFSSPEFCTSIAKNGCSFVYQTFNRATTARFVDRSIFSHIQ